jgi:hypothetical protein
VDSVVVAGRGEFPMTDLPEIGFAGGLGDLEDEDLESLLTALETIEALPVAEPSTVVLGGTGRQGT